MASTRHIAYLVNQYPSVSHTFIRREIIELEKLGSRITRLSVRVSRSGIVDPADQVEFRKTTTLLGNPGRLVLAALQCILQRPVRTGACAWSAARSGLRSSAGLKQFAYLLEACRLLRICERDGISHVHAHMGTNAASVARFCRMLGGPTYSITMHGPEEWAEPVGLELAKKTRDAEFVVCISKHATEQLRLVADSRDHHKVHTVECGVDNAFLDRPASPIGNSQDLVCIGRLCHEKNQLMLVDTFAKLLLTHPSARLTICGDGELRSEIGSKIEAHNLSHAVQLTGWADQDQVISTILGARALVLPSIAEGLPVVIMEAMSLCRPVISTSVAGIPELLETDVNGWLIAPDDPDQLLHAMTDCLETDEQSLNQMGLRGQSSVRRKHDIRKNVLHLYSLYTQLSNRRG